MMGAAARDLSSRTSLASPALLAFALACTPPPGLPEPVDAKIPPPTHDPRESPASAAPASGEHLPLARAPAPGTTPEPLEGPVPGDIRDARSAAPASEPVSGAILTAPPPPGLVDLRAVLPGACFDIRYHTADNFTGAPLPGYDAPGAWLRARPAAALARLQAELADDGLTLLIYDAYRPARASRAMVAWAERTGQRRLVDDGYIAVRSGHNRGDTVDLTLARAGTCDPLDMGTPWDHLGPDSHTRNATGEPRGNRRLLRTKMRAIGFSPYDREWWHFTFNDPGATALDVPYTPGVNPSTITESSNRAPLSH